MGSEESVVTDSDEVVPNSPSSKLDSNNPRISSAFSDSSFSSIATLSKRKRKNKAKRNESILSTASRIESLSKSRSGSATKKMILADLEQAHKAEDTPKESQSAPKSGPFIDPDEIDDDDSGRELESPKNVKSLEEFKSILPIEAFKENDKSLARRRFKSSLRNHGTGTPPGEAADAHASFSGTLNVQQAIKNNQWRLNRKMEPVNTFSGTSSPLQVERLEKQIQEVGLKFEKQLEALVKQSEVSKSSSSRQKWMDKMMAQVSAMFHCFNDSYGPHDESDDGYEWSDTELTDNSYEYEYVYEDEYSEKV